MATKNSIDSNIPVEVSKGGTGGATLTDHGVLVGAATAAITQLTVGTDGQVLVGDSANDPVFATLASAGGTVTFTPGAGTLNLEAGGGSSPNSFPTDSGTATPAAGALTVTGGTNIGTTGAGAAVTVNLDAAVSGLTSLDLATTGRIGTATSAGNTALIQAYDTDLTGYVTFATLTANNTPTMDLEDTVTKAGQYIYRGSGTDVIVADGGTGASSLTAYSVLCGGTTATNPVQAIAGVGTSGQILTSNGAAALPTFQASPGVKVTTYTSSDTWTKDTNATMVQVIIWSGGGGGGSGYRGASTASSGGGSASGSAVIDQLIPASFFGATETVTIGTGGTGGAAQTVNDTNGNDGTAGGESSFGNLSGGIKGNLGSGGTVDSGDYGAGPNSFHFTCSSFTGAVVDGGDGSTADPNPVSDSAILAISTPGGGGAGADSVTERTGADGSAAKNWDSTVTIVAAAAGGVESGTINGANGTSQPSGATSGGWLIGGTGGGGGGGQSVGGAAGTGGTGGTPGGGGGGGGGSLNGTNSGAGGDGGPGKIIVIEYLN